MAWFRGRRTDSETPPPAPSGDAQTTPIEPVDSEGEPTNRGWDAIHAACTRIYGDQEPRHVGYVPGRAFGSVLQGCSAYRADGHWHYVTYGLSNVFDEDEGDNHGFSGHGCELTWRIRDEGGAAEAPGWPFTVLQRIAKWAVDDRFVLMEGRRIALTWPVSGYPDTGGPDTPQTSVLLVTDPELGVIDTANGRVDFVQLVAVDDQTVADIGELGGDAVVDRLRRQDTLMVSVIGR